MSAFRKNYQPPCCQNNAQMMLYSFFPHKSENCSCQGSNLPLPHFCPIYMICHYSNEEMKANLFSTTPASWDKKLLGMFRQTAGPKRQWLKAWSHHTATMSCLLQREFWKLPPKLCRCTEIKTKANEDLYVQVTYNFRYFILAKKSVGHSVPIGWVAHK